MTQLFDLDKRIADIKARLEEEQQRREREDAERRVQEFERDEPKLRAELDEIGFGEELRQGLGVRFEWRDGEYSDLRARACWDLRGVSFQLENDNENPRYYFNLIALKRLGEDDEDDLIYRCRPIYKTSFNEETLLLTIGELLDAIQIEEQRPSKLRREPPTDEELRQRQIEQLATSFFFSMPETEGYTANLGATYQEWLIGQAVAGLSSEIPVRELVAGTIPPEDIVPTIDQIGKIVAALALSIAKETIAIQVEDQAQIED